MKYDRRDILRPFEENSAYIASRVSDGVEKHRKGTVCLHFTLPDGKPLGDPVSIVIEQKSHDFLYGANLFMLGEMETQAKNTAYEQNFAEVFNEGTIPFYWDDLEPQAGKLRFAADSPRIYRRPAPELCMDYCAKHRITPKLHCLTYDNFTPAWVPREVAEIKRLLEKRYREIAEHYSTRIHGIEVINETLCRKSPHGTPFFEAPDYMEWNLRLAEKYFPKNELIINEAQENVWLAYQWNRSPYYMQIERALTKGCRIDAIGMQYHMFRPADIAARETRDFYDPYRLYAVMDQYAQFGKPLQITEATIPCYTAEAEDEAVQAEILRNLYRIWFSHPAMEAIIYWNMVDGYAYQAEPGDMSVGENVYYGGLCRFDGSQKAAYDTIRELFTREWHTRSERPITGEPLEFRGFYGHYEVTLHAGDRVWHGGFHLGKSTEAILNVTLEEHHV